VVKVKLTKKENVEKLIFVLFSNLSFSGYMEPKLKQTKALVPRGLIKPSLTSTKNKEKI
jgi:hypothetical protein